MNIAVIFAGGSGVRFGAGIPKQFLEINGRPIIVHTLMLFQRHHKIDKIYMAVLEDYIPHMEKLVEEFHITKVEKIVPGGDTAQDSIYNGLLAAAEENPGDSVVLIHDGVRPFVAYDVITKNIEGVLKNGNAITCTSCFETILISEDGEKVGSVPYRKNTFAAQAPQSFYLKDIIGYHEQIQKRPERYTDMVDACTIITTLGVEANMIPGNRGNIKVTTPEDVYIFRALIQYRENEQAFGIGLTDQIGHKIRKKDDL